MSTSTWDSGFLDKLHIHWEKDPFLADINESTAFATKDELSKFFFGEHRVANNFFRFWLAKTEYPEHTSDFLIDGNAARQDQNGQLLNFFGPKTNDSFEQFAQRLQGRKFGLNINGLNRFSEQLATRLELLKADLPTVSGVQRFDSFFGTYLSTPFGIHQDEASIIVMCLEGTRTYHTWPNSYFKERGGHLHPTSEHLADAETFELSPGKFFYWPSNRWHVVTTNGSPSITIQLTSNTS